MNIPSSRFKREMNGLLNKFDKGQLDLVFVTRCGNIVFIVTSTNYYEELKCYE